MDVEIRNLVSQGQKTDINLIFLEFKKQVNMAKNLLDSFV